MIIKNYFLKGLNRILKTKAARMISDSSFIKLHYLARVGEPLNLKNPEKFNEKLQWLKLNDRKKVYSNYVDKNAVKKLVSEIIGEKYIVKTLKVYDNVKEIEWSSLPNKFVLKCTHGSGCNIICKDISALDRKKANISLEKWMGYNFYWYAREWPYKNVVPKIILEEFIEENIIDYKFYCFNGEPKFLYVSQGIGIEGRTTYMSFYDLNWKQCEFYRGDHEELKVNVEKPSKFSEMVSIAEKLSKGLKFSRIDLFYVKNQIYFSEITLTPGAGITPFSQLEWEKKIGDWIKLD